MRRDDSVFFFTLIDFLLTALFFGLVLFAVSRVRASEDEQSQRAMASAVDSIRKATGISDLAELTDRLTRLGPVAEAEMASRIVAQAGGIESAKKGLQTIAEAGGGDSVIARLERLRRREGAGLPHCIFQEVGSRKEAVILATVIGTDSTMTWERETPELRSVLARLGYDFDEVRTLGLREFRRAFGRLVQVQPECRYTIVFVEKTRFVDARDAARGLFYMRIRSAL